MLLNLAQGGAGAAGGNGGNGLGGGICNFYDGTPPVPSPSLTLLATNVIANRAIGGAGGPGGAAGLGQGGGLYNDSAHGAVVSMDTFTKIKGNEATTSDDDIFGIVTLI